MIFNLLLLFVLPRYNTILFIHVGWRWLRSKHGFSQHFDEKCFESYNYWSVLLWFITSMPEPGSSIWERNVRQALLKQKLERDECENKMECKWVDVLTHSKQFFFSSYRSKSLCYTKNYLNKHWITTSWVKFRVCLIQLPPTTQ